MFAKSFQLVMLTTMVLIASRGSQLTVSSESIICPSEETMKPCFCDDQLRTITCDIPNTTINNLASLFTELNYRYYGHHHQWANYLNSSNVTFTFVSQGSKISRIDEDSLLQMKFERFGITNGGLGYIHEHAFAATRFTLKLLDLERNRLKDDVFKSLRGLTNLQWISLKSNQIKVIPGDLLQSDDGSFPSNLKGIILSDNRIHDIAGSPFFNFARLQLLDLSSNFLTVIHQETLTLRRNPELELVPLTVNLSSNKLDQKVLTNISWSSFDRPFNLDLSRNLIKMTSWRVFCRFLQASEMNYLDLSYNQWDCDRFRKLSRRFPLARLVAQPCST